MARFPQPVTIRAGPERVVERKQPGFDFLNGETGNRAGEIGGIEVFLVAVSLKRNDQPIRQFERGFNRIRQPGQQFIIIMPDDQAINNDVDIVFALLVEGGEVIHLHHLTINAGALIAAGLHGHQLFPVF
ncbi:MAG TPA: hypothetical protein DGR20_06325, partial [Alphaproteobacteria bacterium]|nr:hypothetical protein [Alphaproteobacteria bacterium]